MQEEGGKEDRKGGKKEKTKGGGEGGRVEGNGMENE